jgi:hypothetical protein
LIFSFSLIFSLFMLILAELFTLFSLVLGEAMPYAAARCAQGKRATMACRRYARAEARCCARRQRQQTALPAHMRRKRRRARRRYARVDIFLFTSHFLSRFLLSSLPIFLSPFDYHDFLRRCQISRHTPLSPF